MAAQTVFYAWQSDSAPKCNRYFIRDAATAAIKALSKEMEVTEAPRLDHDTEGVSGTPDIAQTIFAKIESSSAFLADVTLVGAISQKPAKRKKKTPNPNVMLEIGYAFKAVGYERSILVMNTAFGSPEELPFDLRNRRHPIQYRLSSPDEANVEEVFRGLVEKLKQAIRAVLARSADSKGDDTDKREEEALDRVVRVRSAFQERALRGQFHEFEPQGGVLLISVVPDRDLSPPLNFSERRFHQLQLTTVHGPSSTIAALHSRHLVAQERVGGTGRVFAVTELDRTGTLRIADGLLFDGAASTNQRAAGSELPRGWVYLAYEDMVASAVSRSVHLLREFGVRGRVCVALDLMRIQGFAIGGLSMIENAYYKGRIYGGDGIHPDPILIAEQVLGDKVADVRSALKPAFDSVWLDFGYPRSLNFDESGAWRNRE